MAGAFFYLSVLLTWLWMLCRKDRICFSVPDLLVGTGFILYLIYYIAGTHPADPSGIWNITGLYFFWMLVRQVGSLKSFSCGLFLSAFVQSIWGLFQYLGICASGHSVFPATGGFQNPGIWGGFLVMGWFAGLQCYFSTFHKGGRTGIAAGIFIISCGILFSFSRASWLAWAGGLPFLFFLHPGFCWQWGRQKFFRRIIAGGILLLLGGLLIVFYELRPASADGRLLIWKAGWSLLGEAPWWGHGPGTFEALYMIAQGNFLEKCPEGAVALLASDNWNAFNEYLHFACETGFIGLLAGNILLLFLYIHRDKKASLCLWAAFVALLIFACFSYPFSLLTFQATGMGILGLQTGRKKEFFLPSRRYRIGILIISGLLWIGGEEYLFRERADIFLRSWLSDPFKCSRRQEMQSWYPRLSVSSDFILCYGRQLYLCGEYREAKKILQQACRLRPCSGVLADLGDCFYQCGETGKAEQMLQKAAAMVPSRLLLKYRLFCLYRDTGQPLKAEKIAEEIVRQKVKIVDTYALQIRKEIRDYLAR